MAPMLRRFWRFSSRLDLRMEKACCSRFCLASSGSKVFLNSFLRNATFFSLLNMFGRISGTRDEGADHTQREKERRGLLGGRCV